MKRVEVVDWLESVDDVARRHGAEQLHDLLDAVSERAARHGIDRASVTTPYINTIAPEQQPDYPGDLDVERRVHNLVRWNAMAMVVRANREHHGIGGHISTYASACTLFEVGFNHFFHAATDERAGDCVYFQGHASPGVYARAFLEGRLGRDQLERFRRETGDRPGLSSYPHPWLMPRFWQFPTVSMGLAPITAIYQARFLRYLANRDLADTSRVRVWCLVGDGEMDEPESLGALTLAARERLDNLTMVVNCNLQRLDGPVRGNGKIIQELEGVFRGAGWNVIKVIWGGRWDPLLAADDDGLLVERMNECVDGEYQKYSVESGAYLREHFFGASDDLLALVGDLSDDELEALDRGGHDPEKVYAAYDAAVRHQGAPTVVLAKTVKGYGLGEAGAGSNITHQQKELNEQELLDFRDRFEIPLDDDAVADAPFYRPDEDSPEMQYLRQRRESLGGWLPRRAHVAPSLRTPGVEAFESAREGSDDGEASTTMSFDRILKELLQDEDIGRRIVPIIPDEARTFGLETLFARCGIYAPQGQQYEPVDADQLVHYKESQSGQLLEEGITEGGAVSSFIAAGTAHSTLGTPMIPFFLFYSMFGFQRVGDLLWAAADARARGFLLGCTAGRTTLSGEGLQHQDGHSPLLAATVPTVRAYDPAYAYEVAVIVADGLRRMFGVGGGSGGNGDGDRVVVEAGDVETGNDLLYYLTLYNESYAMPAMPKGVEKDILAGMYRVDSIDANDRSDKDGPRPQLFGSGTLLPEARRAAEMLAEDFGVSSDVWSVTSYLQLRRGALAAERRNRLRAAPEEERATSHLEDTLAGLEGPFVAVTDYMKQVPEQIARWIPGPYVTLGTDGFGRSDTRDALRRHFEIDAAHIAFATLAALAHGGTPAVDDLTEARDRLGIDADKPDPALA